MHGLITAACVGDDAAEHKTKSVAVPLAAVEQLAGQSVTGTDQERFQRLKAESLQLMIVAAQRAMDIGSFQERINAAAIDSMMSMQDAVKQMEDVVTDLKEEIKPERARE